MNVRILLGINVYLRVSQTYHIRFGAIVVMPAGFSALFWFWFWFEIGFAR